MLVCISVHTPKSARCVGLSTTLFPASTSCASDSLWTRKEISVIVVLGHHPSLSTPLPQYTPPSVHPSLSTLLPQYTTQRYELYSLPVERVKCNDVTNGFDHFSWYCLEERRLMLHDHSSTLTLYDRSQLNFNTNALYDHSSTLTLMHYMITAQLYTIRIWSQLNFNTIWSLLNINTNALFDRCSTLTLKYYLITAQH